MKLNRRPLDTLIAGVLLWVTAGLVIASLFGALLAARPGDPALRFADAPPMAGPEG